VQFFNSARRNQFAISITSSARPSTVEEEVEIDEEGVRPLLTTTTHCSRPMLPKLPLRPPGMTETEFRRRMSGRPNGDAALVVKKDLSYVAY
jgi:hypothetical protein